MKRSSLSKGILYQNLILKNDDALLRRFVFSRHHRRWRSSKTASRMAALLCRTCSRPLGVALEQLHHRIAFLRSTPPLPALSQLQTHSLACNLRAWQARVQPALAGKAFRGCRAFPASSDTDAAVDTRPKLVFLGTPEVISSFFRMKSRVSSSSLAVYDVLLASRLLRTFCLSCSLLQASQTPSSRYFSVLHGWCTQTLHSTRSLPSNAEVTFFFC